MRLFCTKFSLHIFIVTEDLRAVGILNPVCLGDLKCVLGLIMTLAATKEIGSALSSAFAWSNKIQNDLLLSFYFFFFFNVMQ